MANRSNILSTQFAQGSKATLRVSCLSSNCLIHDLWCHFLLKGLLLDWQRDMRITFSMLAERH